MSPKKAKAAAKKEEEESSSASSSSSDSSSEEEAKAPAPKKKAVAKGKAKAEADSDSSSDGDEKKPAEEGGAEKSTSAEKEPAEVKKFEPPPRPVFTPHTAMGDITGPQDPPLQYCPNCGLPPDFCIYGPSWAKCQPWCLEHYPQYYPELSGVNLEEAKKKADQAADKAKVKELPGGKKKREASPAVQIKRLTRGGRKCVTSVAGLDAFGVKLDDAAKKFKKKFSCGASVVKGDHGSGDTVDIQGDFEEEVVDLIAADFGVPREKVSFLDGGTKKKGKGR